MRRVLLLTATCLVVALSANVILALNQESGVKAQATDSEWYMAGANLERTSWVSEEVSGNLSVDWYRPIEAYIDQKVQVIAADGKLYIATARGLYVLNAGTGSVEWRYDTQMPLGHSPTVIDGKVFFGGYDKKIHALNALNGNEIWEFEGAKAGFSVNPLVINNKVYAGNRDGYFYALDANTGNLVWQYPRAGQDPLGPIKYSAAYNNGVLYFASTDMHAYALDAETGSLVWKSAKLPGESFQSYWPVIYRDKVILSGSYGYRHGDPGTQSLECDYYGQTVDCPDFINRIEREDIFFIPESNPQPGDLVGPTFSAGGPEDTTGIDWDWVEGTTVMDGSRITEYFEDDGQVKFDRHTNKPWRRTYFVLNQSDGTEYTFDSDGDGNPEYAPILQFGTKSGNAYPPIAMPNDVIYQNNCSEYRGWISGGQVMGWKLGTHYLGIAGRYIANTAVDEPQAISGGGNLIYRNLCCDRYGHTLADITDPQFRGVYHWDINNESLDDLAPGYDQMWVVYPGWPRLIGHYKGKINSVNGIYHNVGDQNPIVPYDGKIYAHRSNAIIAFSPNGGGAQLPLLEINEVQDDVSMPSTDQLKEKLEKEVQAIVDAGHLRPGYHNAGQFGNRQLHLRAFINYFENPGDTLYTLTRAYPYLSPTLQQQARSFLEQEYNTYFAGTMYSKIGWDAGPGREYMDLPPEVEEALANHPKEERSWHGVSWNYPQYNFYAMWKYAELFPDQAVSVYEKAKEKLEVPCPADNAGLAEYPWKHNAFITGYIGFLNLQELAGKDQEDATLRISVQQELDRLLALRANGFEKDNPWCTLQTMGNAQKRATNLGRNFLYLVPELGDYLHDHALSKIQEAVNEYNLVGPFWFVSSFEGTYQEGVVQNLYDQVIFQAKAYILREPREELIKYLDVPAFKRGDLFYIQNLVAMLEAKPSGITTPTPTSTVTARPTNTPTPTGTLTPPPFGVYVPIIMKAWPPTAPTPTPTQTPITAPTGTLPTATPTSTPTPTVTPTSTPTNTPTLTPTISNPTTNLADYSNGQVPRYEKFEVTFEVNTVAENLQLPYDPSPPPGLEPGIGITVNALFTPDNWQTVHTQPAFYYQEFQDEIKGGREWFYPTGNYFWKVRFSPNQVGTWQYELTAQDASGTAETTPQSFTVSPSDNKGFVRVSENDSRYFEYEDGTYFPSLGYNMNAQNIDWVNPVLSNEEHFQKMGQDGIQLVRLWLSQWGIYTSAWNPWNSPNPEHHAQYIPISGISFDEVYSPDSELSMMIGWPEKWWLGSCMFIGGWKAKPAVKRNTDYRVRVRYKTFNITGPRIAGYPYGFVAKTGGWFWGEGNHCYDPGVGTVVTPYQSSNTSDWEILEGTIHIDNRNTDDFLPYFYLALENLNSGAVYIDYVWIEEDLGGGQYGPNIASKPWMDHHRYMEQRNSYAFDKLLNLAKQYGVYLRPVILEKNEPIFNLIDYDGSFTEWSNNHFYGNWRQMTKTRWLQQAWWRYLQARWGYSTHIHSWELLNEGDPWNGLHYTLADEFGKYMHCRVFGVDVGGWGEDCTYDHPNDHIVSTSNWNSFPRDNFWANPDYPDVDFADYHRYVPSSDPNFYDTAQSTYDVSMQYGAKQLGGAGKPVIRGEIGFVTSESGSPSDEILQDTEGIWLHNLIWGGINPGGLIESYWYENKHIYSRNRDGTYDFDHRNQYGNYYNFIKDIPLNNGHYQGAGATVSDDNLRAWGQKDLVNGNAHLWIQNKNHTWKNVVDGVSIPEVSGEVTITGFAPNKQYTLEWWDAYTGPVSKTEPVTTDGDGNVQVQISNLQDDLAVRILNPD